MKKKFNLDRILYSLPFFFFFNFLAASGSLAVLATICAAVFIVAALTLAAVACRTGLGLADDVVAGASAAALVL